MALCDRFGAGNFNRTNSVNPYNIGAWYVLLFPSILQMSLPEAQSDKFPQITSLASAGRQDLSLKFNPLIIKPFRFLKLIYTEL